MLDHMVKCGWKNTAKRPSDPVGRKIRSLWLSLRDAGALTDPSEKALRAFVKRTAGVEHTPYLDGDRGAVKFGYAVAHIKGGGKHVEVMTVREIEKIRDRSQNVKNAKRFGKETPWDTDFEEMARKTLIRRICKYLPKSNELAMAMALDDAAGRGAQNLSVDDAIAGTFVPPVIEGEAAEKAEVTRADGAEEER